MLPPLQPISMSINEFLTNGSILFTDFIPIPQRGSSRSLHKKRKTLIREMLRF